jgi:predicted nucleic acid-binding protein
MATKLQKLLFIDTNIWLDFYRARNETGLKLLDHAESVANKIIVTYQLESEFKRNRQTAIIEGMSELKAPTPVARPGIFSDAKASAFLAKSNEEADKRVKALKAKLTRVLQDPAVHVPSTKPASGSFTGKVISF